MALPVFVFNLEKKADTVTGYDIFTETVTIL